MVLWGTGQLTWVWKHGGNSIPAMGFQPKPTDSRLLSRCTAIFRFCFTFAFMLSCRFPKAWWVCLCVSWAQLGLFYAGAVVEHHLADITTAFLESQWHPFTIIFPFGYNHSPLPQFKSSPLYFRKEFTDSDRHGGVGEWGWGCCVVGVLLSFFSVSASCKLKELMQFMNNKKRFC